MDLVEKIAAAVMYEGYLLYPYRRSSMKNQQRWTFGGIYPRAYSEAGGGDDPWSMETQCLVVGDAKTRIEVKVRFLQIVDRRVTETVGETSRPVEALRVGEQVHQPWEEAVEREVTSRFSLAARASPHPGPSLPTPDPCLIEISEGSEAEPLVNPDGREVGALVREWRSLGGALEIGIEPLASGCFRLTVRILNNTPWTGAAGGGDRPERGAALRQSFISTHTIFRVQGGEFVSLLEPPDEYQQTAQECKNVGTWPVLVGGPGERHTLLSSPIILYDYPQISPESPGDLFDATEIDELLTLSILSLTDDERQEMRESDARARAILERTESLSMEQLMKLHGAVRGLQPLRRDDR